MVDDARKAGIEVDVTEDMVRVGAEALFEHPNNDGHCLNLPDSAARGLAITVLERALGSDAVRNIKRYG